MNNRNKKAQVTLFIIIALLIVLVLIILLWPRIKPVFLPSVFSPEVYFSSCVEEDFENAIERVSSQGGSINPELYLNYKGNNIEYLCYTSEFYQTCVIQKPLIKSHIERELSEELSSKVSECFDKTRQESIQRGFKIESQIDSPKVEISRNNIDLNIPVNFVLGTTQELLCTALTNQNGVASCYVKSLGASRQIQVAQAFLDVAAFANLEANSVFLKQVEHSFPVAPARFLIKVAPLTIFVQSSERDHYNRQLDVNLLEPALKEVLSLRGFAFTDDLSQADLMVDISAKARHGSNVQGICFSFVDANLSVIDLKDGTEAWKTVISSKKGAGADYSRATVKAFEEAAEEIKQTMPEQIN